MHDYRAPIAGLLLIGLLSSAVMAGEEAPGDQGGVEPRESVNKKAGRVDESGVERSGEVVDTRPTPSDKAQKGEKHGPSAGTVGYR